MVGEAYELKGVRTKKSRKNSEGKVRHGLKKSKACGKQFTVRIGTIFEDSHIDLHLWLQAVYLMTGQQEGDRQPPALPDAGHHRQVRVVHIAPHPRGHAR